MTLELFGATGSAFLSPCGRYRYRLDRVFRLDGKRVCWVMLNPSTADATATDPTLTRCIGYARRWGFGALTIVNLFAWRATKPKDLPTDVVVAVGPEADVHIADALEVPSW